MKPRLWAAVLIFLSGYSPLLIILCFRDFDFSTYKFGHPVAVIALTVTAAISIVLVFVALRSIHSNMRIRIVRLQSRATDLVNYSLPYIVSFFGLKLSDPHDMGSLAILMSLLFVLAFRTRALFINPILACAGYHLYQADYEENGHLKSRDILVKGEPNVGDVYRAELLSTNLLLITSHRRDGQEIATADRAQQAEEATTPRGVRELMASP